MRMTQNVASILSHINTKRLVMCQAPRPKGKAKKIAYKLLGVPQNMKKSRKPRKQVEERLVYEETSRVR